MKVKTAFMTAAVAGLVLGAQAHASGGKDTHGKKGAAKVQCHGVNGCKGKGQCGGADHSCAGHNECKGKGWVYLSKADCKKKGGTVQ